MHHRKILRAIILVFAFAFCGAALAAKVDVYQEFQTKIETVEKGLRKEKDVSKRYDLFLKSYKDLLDLRKKNPRQAESKELNMSLFIDALAPFPAKKDFQGKKCPQYLKDIRSSMKSYAADPKEPFIDKALSVAQLICQ